MKTHNNLYDKIISLENLILAWKKARKGKTKRDYVQTFEENIAYNLKILRDELESQTYKPRLFRTFILRDPKTRKISKSDFRDRIVHHALCNVIEPLFDKSFIYDNCANRKEKGTTFALNRFEKFQRRVTNNLSKEAFCLKADIRHYFEEINHNILLENVKRKIKCEKTIWLIEQILDNKLGTERERETRKLQLIKKECR
jgi:retron-type reverse transcriptase